MTYGAQFVDLLDALAALADRFHRPGDHLGTSGERTVEASHLARLRYPVARCVARMVDVAAAEQARHISARAHQEYVAAQAARLGARAGAELSARLGESGIAAQIAGTAAADIAARIASEEGREASTDEITERVRLRTAEHVTARVLAQTDLTDARAIARTLGAPTASSAVPRTPLAEAAADLAAATTAPDLPRLADGDLLASSNPMIASWQAAARAAILMIERELPQLGPLTTGQVARLAADAALVQRALTHLAGRLDDLPPGERPGRAPLPAVPVDDVEPRAGIDHLGHQPRRPRTRPVIPDGIDETLWALDRLTEGMNATTPHARAAYQTAHALALISDHLSGFGHHRAQWTTRASAFNELRLALADIHSGAGATAATHLAADAAAAITSVTTLPPHLEADLLTAVDDVGASLCRAVSTATSTHLYTVVAGHRQGPVVRATRQLIPVHAFATPARAPELHAALAGVPAPAPSTRTVVADDPDVEQARDHLAGLLRTFAEVSRPDPAHTPRPTPGMTQADRIYVQLRAGIADGTYTGRLPSSAVLAKGRAGRAAARAAIAKLAAEGLVTITDRRTSRTRSVEPAVTVVTPDSPRATWRTVYDDVRAQILDGTLTGKLPTAAQLAARHGVSTAVAHTAAAALAKEGLVYRVRGGAQPGTYVKTPDSTPPTARWRTIYQDLREHITAGIYTERLPTIEELAQHYEVGVSTIQNATTRLALDGLVYQRAGGTKAGVYVTTNPDPAGWRTAHEHLKARITAGELDGRLPSASALARQLGTDEEAVARATAQLARDGLISHREGAGRRGLYITPQTAAAPDTRWRAIYEDLKAGIADGTYSGLLPSGRQLAARHQTSVAPVRQAIARLNAEGLVQTIRDGGRHTGTYVTNTPPPPAPAGGWATIYEHLRTGIDDGTYTGRLPSATELAATHHASPTTVHKALRKLEAHGRVYRLNDGERTGTYVVPPDGVSTQPARSRIYQDLREHITAGIYVDRLPTLEELAQQYGTSRKPVRAALARLTYDGLLTRSPGKGFLANPPAADATASAPEADVVDVVPGRPSVPTLRERLDSILEEPATPGGQTALTPPTGPHHRSPGWGT